MSSLRTASKLLVQFGIAAAILAGSVFVFKTFQSLAPAQQSREVGDQRLRVSTMIPGKYSGAVEIKASGLVVARREIKIASEIAGTIVFKAPNFEAGRFIKAGTEILRIDDRDYQNEVERLNTELSSANVQIQEIDLDIAAAKELVELVRKDLDVQQREFERKQKIRDSLTETELNQSERNLNAAKNALITQSNTLRLLETRRTRQVSSRDLAQLQLQKAELNLTRTKILAPADGVVVEDSVEVGSFIQPGGQLLIFEDTSKAEVNFNLKADDLYLVMQDQRARRTPAGSDDKTPFFDLPKIEDVAVEFKIGREVLTWTGRLDGYAGYGFDQQTRNVPCRVVVDQPMFDETSSVGNLRRGMFVTVRIPVKPIFNLLAVPEAVVYPGEVVWVVRQGKLKKFNVEVVGRLRDGSVQGTVSSAVERDLNSTVLIRQEEGGLLDSDQVVNSPLPMALEGQEVVTVTEGEQKSTADANTQPNLEASKS